jgi:hypothetical protein
MTYEHFQGQIVGTLRAAQRPLTWTEIRTTASLPQLFPNNQWVHRLERDIGLVRSRDAGGIIHWRLSDTPGGYAASVKTTESPSARARRKQSIVE